MSDSKKARLAIVATVAMFGEANWTRQIKPYLEAMGVPAIGAAKFRLLKDGALVRTGPDTYRLAQPGPWANDWPQSVLLHETPGGNQLWFHP